MEIKPIGTVANVPYANVQSNPNNARQKFDAGLLKSLADSIAANGLQQLPVVNELADKPGHYMLESGERRYRAIGLLGWDTIPVLVKVRTSPDQARIGGLIENLQRVDITPYEAGLEMQRIKTEYKLNAQTISEMLGLSRSYVHTLITCHDLLSDDVKRLWRDGNPRATVDFLRQLTKVPRDKQLEAFQEPAESGDGKGGEGGSLDKAAKHNCRKFAQKLQAALLQMTSKEDKDAISAQECVGYILGSRKRPPQGISFKNSEE